MWNERPFPWCPDADDDENQPVELGVKFRSDVDGFITGVRFYKGAANTGTHIGNLWTSTGTLLATATFTSETSGWQQVSFGAPVAITANTTYVASYHTNVGHYSATGAYFSQRWHRLAPASCAGHRDRRQRRLHVRRERVPDPDLQRDQLLGRRRVRARARGHDAAKDNENASLKPRQGAQ